MLAFPSETSLPPERERGAVAAEPSTSATPAAKRASPKRPIALALVIVAGGFGLVTLRRLAPDVFRAAAPRTGGDPATIFTREAVTLIHEYSRGLPRTISVMCDKLTSGFALDQRPVGGDIVREVIRDFDLHAAPGASAAATPHLALVKTAAEGASSSSGAL